MSLHKKATIVIYLVLQSTPTYVNAVAGYSIIAPDPQPTTVSHTLPKQESAENRPLKRT